MKRICIFLFLLLSSIWIAKIHVASAHGSGPPFILINREYAQTNPLTNYVTPTQFSVGADVASTSGYLVDQSILFEIDKKFFPNPYAQAVSPFGLPVTNQPPPVDPLFRWDFGDGSPQPEGDSVTHTYTKPGTYFAQLQAKFLGKTEDFAGNNTIQIDIFPSADYSKPQAKISVNGAVIEDPARDTIEIKPARPVTFEAVSTSGNIISYQWDFGNDKGATEKLAKHRFGRDEYFPVAVLRVTDDNGLIYDTFALLDLPLQNDNPIFSIYYSVVDFITGIFSRE